MNDYRRILIDSHIADWDKIFHSKFNPKNYVKMLKIANVSSAMIYSSCHVGNSYYPTKIGHQHAGLDGRDVLGEIINLCYKENIKVVIYYSLIFNNWVYTNYPDWRVIKDDEPTGPPKFRYGTVCPNSPYKDFAIKQIKEICENYKFESIFFDMTFWPGICYCNWCKKRYLSETNSEIPKAVEWENPVWLKFQRAREKWIKEFAQVTTNEVKKIRPLVTVNHQFSTALHDWRCGVPLELSDACDYLGGDFYGDYTQRSFACKLFLNLTNNKPFEFHISRTPDLSDHTSTKPLQRLETEAFQIIGHSGRVLFIDAINPDGSLEEEVYHEIAKVFKKVRKYEKYLGGELVQDVAIYFSFESKIPTSNHLASVMNVCKTLIGAHIPFGVITRKNLAEISKYRLIILTDVVMMDEQEVEAFSSYVKSGGKLYASKNTSLFHPYKGKMQNFMLSDLFGVDYEGITDENVTYFKASSPKYLVLFSNQIKVKLREGKIKATLTLPYTNPKDASRFASIHSNPPGVDTEYPSIVERNYGKGKVYYASGDIESVDNDVHRKVFLSLITRLYGGDFFFEADAPKSVEIIAFYQPDRRRYIFNVINYQYEPNAEIKLNLRIRDRKILKVVRLPENRVLKFRKKQNYVEIPISILTPFTMFAAHI